MQINKELISHMTWTALHLFVRLSLIILFIKRHSYYPLSEHPCRLVLYAESMITVTTLISILRDLISDSYTVCLVSRISNGFLYGMILSVNLFLRQLHLLGEYRWQCEMENIKGRTSELASLSELVMFKSLLKGTDKLVRAWSMKKRVLFYGTIVTISVNLAYLISSFCLDVQEPSLKYLMDSHGCIVSSCPQLLEGNIRDHLIWMFFFITFFASLPLKRFSDVYGLRRNLLVSYFVHLSIYLFIRIGVRRIHFWTWLKTFVSPTWIALNFLLLLSFLDHGMPAIRSLFNDSRKISAKDINAKCQCRLKPWMQLSSGVPTLEQFLDQSTLLPRFEQFCVSFFCRQQFLFLRFLREARLEESRIKDASIPPCLHNPLTEVAHLVDQLLSIFFLKDAPCHLELFTQTRRNLFKSISSSKASLSVELFKDAELEVLERLRIGAYTRFLEIEENRRLVIKEHNTITEAKKDRTGATVVEEKTMVYQIPSPVFDVKRRASLNPQHDAAIFSESSRRQSYHSPSSKILLSSIPECNTPPPPPHNMQ